MTEERTYHVSLTNRAAIRGLRRSRRSWRVRCFSLPVGDMNSLGRTIEETYHRTEAQARARAADLRELYQIKEV